MAIRPGEVVPVDGMVAGGPAVLDESALTGESRLVTHEDGSPVSSGTVNAGSAFDLRAAATAADSAYAGIVRLVKEAQTSRRLSSASRTAMPCLRPVHPRDRRCGVAAVGRPGARASGAGRGDTVPAAPGRPIAIVAGISRAASRGVIVKGGGALETLARAR